MRTHNFQAMKGVHRRLVHELAPFYGCETGSYDPEPCRSVIAKAVRSVCNNSFQLGREMKSFMYMYMNSSVCVHTVLVYVCMYKV